MLNTNDKIIKHKPCPIPNESEARPYFQYEMSLREVK